MNAFVLHAFFLVGASLLLTAGPAGCTPAKVEEDKAPAPPPELVKQLTDDQVKSEKDIIAKIVSWGGTADKAGTAIAQKMNAHLPVNAVHLQHSKVADEDLALLVNLPHLTVLELDGTEIGDKGLVHIGKCSSLRTLQLMSTRVSDYGMEHLASLKNLSQLRLYDTYITDKGLRALKGLPSIQTLMLNSTMIEDDGLTVLATFPNLTTLHLGRDPWYSEQGSKTAIAYNANDPVRVTDAGLVHLKDLPNLRNLTLSGTGYTDAGFATLANFSRLRTLKFSGTYVTERGVTNLQLRLPNCQITRELPRDPANTAQ